MKLVSSIVYGLALVCVSSASATATVDARLTLDTSGAPPRAGAPFRVVAAVESLPKPTGPPFNFVVTVTLPAGVELVSSSRGESAGVPCETSGRTLTCTGRHNINLNLRAATAGTYALRASVRIEGEADSNPSNDTADLSVTVQPAAATCAVPNVRGKPVAAATRAITRAGCRAGAVRTVRSATVPKGLVVRQTPAAGARVARGTRVTLVVSRGPH